MAGAQLHFKAEHLQRVGAFKFRGACNAVWSLQEEQARARRGHAFVGQPWRRAGPGRADPWHRLPRGGARRRGGNQGRFDRSAMARTLHTCAASTAAREEQCARVQQQTGAVLIHPYTDPRVIAGQGTAALELLNAVGALDVLVVPVGGGGLAAGTAIAAATLAPGCQVLLAEPAGAADAFRSLAAGERRTDFTPDTLCDGLRGVLGQPNFELLRQFAVEVLTVADADTVRAMRLLWQTTKQLVEPSSAIALAAVLQNPQRFAGQRVGVVLSGGNVDLDALPWRAA